MLKTIRKYRRSVLGVVGIGLIALSMGGFGVNMASDGGQKNYAIKVGDREISFDEFGEIRREIDARYRKMLGDNYAQMLKSFNVNVAQQAIDSAINNTLLDKFAAEIGLSGSSQSVQQMIHTEIFGGQFDPQRYTSYLASQGISAVQFEEKLRREIARQQLVDLFTDSSKASAREAKAVLERDKTAYSFITLSIDNEEIKKTVAEPGNDEISKYYDENLTDFQIPPQVSYDYIVLEPADFYSKVPYTQDDIELEYTDNPSAYQTKPELRISQILLQFPEKASDDQKAKTRDSAKGIAGKLKNGDKFEELAKIYSKDAASALKGGDLGWVTKESLPKSVAEKAFAAKVGAIVDPIEANNSIYILRVEDKKDTSLKPLEEVKDDIIKKIQTRDAESVLVLKAQELFDAWSKSSKSLADFGKENSLKDPKPGLKLSKEQSPETGLKDLTANILATPEEKQQLIEIGDKQVMVEVKDFSEERVETLENVKPRIADILKTKTAKEQARLKANQILESIKKGEYSGLKQAAEKNSLKPEEILEVTVSSAKGVVADPQVRDRVFKFSSAPQMPSEVFSVGNNFALVELTAIKKPSPEELQSGIENMQRGLTRDLSEFSLDAFISKLKSETTIDIKPGILAEQ